MNEVEILPAADVSELADHEAIIAAGLKTFIDVGVRLATIRDKRLYRGDYATFEAYCEGRWSFSDRRARQLIDAALVVTALPAGTIVPVTESQARELSGLNPAQAATVMRVAHRHDGAVTASVIRAARMQPWTDAEITSAVDGYQIHPYIAMFPAFKPGEWQGLVDSIREFGLIQPIMVSSDGTAILDGRFRYLALKWLGMDPATTTTCTGEPALRRATFNDEETLVNVVYAINCLRYHYSDGQKAFVLADAETVVPGRCGSGASK